MKELTKAEEQIMQVIWNGQELFIKDIIKELPKPKPAYTTVATFLKILETKGFVERKQYGNTFAYSASVKKSSYLKSSFKNLLGKYFDGSPRKMLSFLVEQNEIDLATFEEIKKQLKKKDNDH